MRRLSVNGGVIRESRQYNRVNTEHYNWPESSEMACNVDSAHSIAFGIVRIYLIVHLIVIY